MPCAMLYMNHFQMTKSLEFFSNFMVLVVYSCLPHYIISSLMMLLTFASSTQSLLQYKAHKQILKKQWEEDTE